MVTPATEPSFSSVLLSISIPITGKGFTMALSWVFSSCISRLSHNLSTSAVKEAIIPSSLWHAGRGRRIFLYVQLYALRKRVREQIIQTRCFCWKQLNNFSLIHDLSAMMLWCDTAHLSRLGAHTPLCSVFVPACLASTSPAALFLHSELCAFSHILYYIPANELIVVWLYLQASQRCCVKLVVLTSFSWPSRLSKLF